MRSKFPLPIVEEPLLDNNQGGIQLPMRQPVNDKINGNLRLAQSLLMEDCCILKILDSVDGFELVCECLVRHSEVGLPL